MDQKFNINFDDPDIIKGRNLAKAYNPNAEMEPTAAAMSREATFKMAYRDYIYIDRKIAIHQTLLGDLQAHSSLLERNVFERTFNDGINGVHSDIEDVQAYLGSLVTKRSNRLSLLEKMQDVHDLIIPNQRTEPNRTEP